MPLRGKHPGHKPYRIRAVFANGRVTNRSYHWRGPWEEFAEWCRMAFRNEVLSEYRVWQVKE